jgi:hypothetical protein
MCGNLAYIYKDACRLAQARGLAHLIYHEPALEVRFIRGAAGTARNLTTLTFNYIEESRRQTGHDS